MVQSVKRAADILMVIAGDGQNMTLEEIDRATNLNKSTCAHIISTLCDAGFVTRISRKEGYCLGPFVYLLTQNRCFKQELIQICSPIMNWLHRRTGETVLLSVMYEGYKLIIHRIDGRRQLSDVRTRLIKGVVYPTATGRMLLAHMPREELCSIYSRLGPPRQEEWSGVHNLKDMEAALERIRRAGYVKATDEPDVVGYACILRAHSGEPVAALGMAVPERLSDDSGLISDLKRAAQEINRRLSFEESETEKRAQHPFKE